jgi:hypothetical protein
VRTHLADREFGAPLHQELRQPHYLLVRQGRAQQGLERADFRADLGLAGGRRSHRAAQREALAAHQRQTLARGAAQPPPPYGGLQQRPGGMGRPGGLAWRARKLRVVRVSKPRGEHGGRIAAPPRTKPSGSRSSMASMSSGLASMRRMWARIAGVRRCSRLVATQHTAWSHAAARATTTAAHGPGPSWRGPPWPPAARWRSCPRSSPSAASCHAARRAPSVTALRFLAAVARESKAAYPVHNIHVDAVGREQLNDCGTVVAFRRNMQRSA